MVTAIHAPLIPIKGGSTNSPAERNTKVLKKDIIAEILPFEKAVNKAEENILNPENKKDILYSINPLMAKLYTLLPLCAKMLVRRGAQRLEEIYITRELASTKEKQYLKILFI